MEKKFCGVIPALLTPFRDDRVDTEALKRLVDFLIENGVHGLYPCGTTGEGMLMNSAERKLVAETVVEAAKNRVPVMVHVGAFSTSETVDLALHARSIGADAVGVVAPYFYKVDREGLLRHYKTVADAVSDMPVYIYNLPGNTGNDIPPALAGQIAAACPNVVGIKDSSKDLARLEAYIAQLGPEYQVIVGSDALVLPTLVMGGAGVISAVANVFPEPVVGLYNAFKAGDLKKARELQFKVNKLRDTLKQGPYLAAFKAALSMRGVEFGGSKSPLRALNADGVGKLESDLKALGVLTD